MRSGTPTANTRPPWRGTSGAGGSTRRPRSQDHLDGAFGFRIRTNRRPSSLTGYDETGRLVARKTFIADPRDATSVNDLAGDFGYCTGVAGCPPWLE
ncbi:MAG: hypothetical protein JWR30_3867 [Conexibacter sp.]|nr:hypothetical protein [Conexibacter sp.]